MEKYSFKINGHDYEVEVCSVSGRNAHVKVNGTEYDVEIGSDGIVSEAGQDASVNGGNALNVRQSGNTGNAGNAGNTGGLCPEPADSGVPQGGETVTAPLPGVIVDVKVKVGDSVRAGQTVAVLEAMKMENEIEAPVSGTVTAVNVSKGDSVLEGAPIASIG